mgnify:CR=1 FL=1
MKKLTQGRFIYLLGCWLLLTINIFCGLKKKSSFEKQLSCNYAVHPKLLNNSWQIVEVKDISNKSYNLSNRSFFIRFDSIGAFMLIEEENVIYKGRSVKCKSIPYKFFIVPTAEKIDGLLQVQEIWDEEDWKFNIKNNEKSSTEMSQLVFILNHASQIVHSKDSVNIAMLNKQQVIMKIQNNRH